MRKLLTLLAATAFMATPVFADNSNDVLQQIPGQNNGQPTQIASTDAAVGPTSEAQSQKNAPEGTMTTSTHHKKCHKGCHRHCKSCKKHHHHKGHHHKSTKAKTDANADQTAAPAAPADQSAAPAAAPAQ